MLSATDSSCLSKNWEYCNCVDIFFYDILLKSYFRKYFVFYLLFFIKWKLLCLRKNDVQTNDRKVWFWWVRFDLTWTNSLSHVNSMIYLQMNSRYQWNDWLNLQMFPYFIVIHSGITIVCYSSLAQNQHQGKTRVIAPDISNITIKYGTLFFWTNFSPTDPHPNYVPVSRVIFLTDAYKLLWVATILITM